MALFLQNCLTFPSIIFSGLLIIVIFYWLCAAVGLLDIDLFHLDAADYSIDASHGIDTTGFAGWLTKLGLAGIPATIILTLFTLFGWLLSYFSVHWFIRHIDIIFLRYLVGFVVLLITAFISLQLTAICLKPIRNKLIKNTHHKSVNDLMGKVAIVRSGQVNESRGEAIMEDGGAGLILQIRASSSDNIQRGTRVVIISYDPVTHSYQVVTEAEFSH